MMISHGFVLKNLILRGTGVPAAEVTFSAGLNVISGPSDTGKTYIVQCIDFMLGASSSPKQIPEAGRYESIVLTVCERNSGAEYILERSLRGGGIYLTAPDGTVRPLSAKHAPGREDTISALLLHLSGFQNRLVRTNKRGTTRQLSFRDIARLTIVDEESVITERSPILSGRPVSKPVEQSVFSLFLTGIDDSTIVEEEDVKSRKTREEGRREVIEVLLARAREEASILGPDFDPASLKVQLEELDSVVESQKAKLSQHRESATELETARQITWRELKTTESRYSVVSEVGQRLRLLSEQYLSDCRRLQAIAEAGFRLGQMQGEHCPLCGALPENQRPGDECVHISPEALADSCTAEIAKITSLLDDLREAIADNSGEEHELRYLKRELSDQLAEADRQLKETLQPRIDAILESLATLQSQRQALAQAIGAFDRVEELESFEIPTTPVTPGSTTGRPDLPLREVGDLCQIAEEMLRAWQFPGIGPVTFSESDRDIVIAGHRRASHGKGVRALTHTVFNLALLEYCRRKGLPHPGLVVVDSPLVVYREPDASDGSFNPHVKDAFFRFLTNDIGDLQVVIFENEDPPADIAPQINWTKFTGTGHGRKGFIPESNDGA